MTEFQINTVAWGDRAGLGQWLIGHYRQHLRYNSKLAGRSPAVIIPEYPILNIGDSRVEARFWLDAHYSWHQQLRTYANITGIDLSAVDFTDRNEFYSWQDQHNAEHSLLDLAFGV